MIRPFLGTPTRPFTSTELVRPAASSAGATVVATPSIDDAEHLAWITHIDNPAMNATVATTTAASLYPTANLKLLPITAVWRSTTAGSAQDITLNMGAAIAVDILALVCHNLTSAATIAIAAGSTASYADYSTTITWREFVAFKRLSTPVTYQYWRIRITDTGNTDGFIEVGYPIVGLLTKPQYKFRQGWTNTAEIKTGVVYSEFGIKTVEELSKTQHLHFKFGPLTDANIFLLRRMHVTVKRNVYPLLILPERGGTDAYFGTITSPFDETVNIRRSVEMQFQEENFGQRIGA